MSKSTGALAGAIVAAVGSAALLASGGHADAQGRDKCYGVSEAGANGCAAGPGTTCAGTSTIDFQGNAWVLVPAGQCDEIVIDDAEDGRVRVGSLDPLARDLPRVEDYPEADQAAYEAELPTYTPVEGFEPFADQS